jgi:hypothetical protein
VTTKGDQFLPSIQAALRQRVGGDRSSGWERISLKGPLPHPCYQWQHGNHSPVVMAPTPAPSWGCYE